MAQCLAEVHAQVYGTAARGGAANARLLITAVASYFGTDVGVGFLSRLSSVPRASASLTLTLNTALTLTLIVTVPRRRQQPQQGRARAASRQRLIPGRQR
jgi:heme A synthase